MFACNKPRTCDPVRGCRDICIFFTPQHKVITGLLLHLNIKIKFIGVVFRLCFGVDIGLLLKTFR